LPPPAENREKPGTTKQARDLRLSQGSLGALPAGEIQTYITLDRSYTMKIKSNIRAGKKGSSINNTVVQIASYISRCVGL
jgi:hypothetical protein